jgi:hypothetical protein
MSLIVEASSLKVLIPNLYFNQSDKIQEYLS